MRRTSQTNNIQNIHTADRVSRHNCDILQIRTFDQKCIPRGNRYASRYALLYICAVKMQVHFNNTSNNRLLTCFKISFLTCLKSHPGSGSDRTFASERQNTAFATLYIGGSVTCSQKKTQGAYICQHSHHLCVCHEFIHTHVSTQIIIL